MIGNVSTLRGETALTPFVMDNPVFDAGQFQNMLAVAELMAKAKLVPEHLQDKPADCFLVVEQARRWNMSPFAIAQETYVVKGKLLFGGKLVTAVVNSRAPIKEPLAFSFDGEKDQRFVTASATFKGESEPRTFSISIFDAKAVAGNSSLWKTAPDQQACYFAARFWARRHCPEVILGVWSEDEITDEPRDITPAEQQRTNAETRRKAMEAVEAVDAVSVYGETVYLMPDEVPVWVAEQVAEPVDDITLQEWASANAGPLEARVFEAMAAELEARKAKAAKRNGNGEKKPVPELNGDGETVVTYSDGHLFIAAMEAATPEVRGWNLETITKIALGRHAPPELRNRAEALRVRLAEPSMV